MIKYALTATAAALMLGTVPVQAQDYPTKPVNLIVPFEAGGNGDSSARLFTQYLRKALDAEVVVQNRAGAGGTIGMTELAGADADGYTLGYTAIAPVTVQPHVRKLSYGRDSFEAVCMVVDTPIGVTVAPDSPYYKLDDLIEAARNETVVSVGPAPGSIPHLAQAAVANAYGVEFKYLPVGAGAEQARAILGGDAQLATDTAAMEETFGLRTLAVLSDERFADLPDVPTLKELGTDLTMSIWFGLFAPAGTPEDVLNRLDSACTEAMADPEFLEAMSNASFIVRNMPREAFTEFYHKQFDGNRELLEIIGLAGE